MKPVKHEKTNNMAKVVMWISGLFLLVQISDASAYDPQLTWWTVKTPHFEVHYHQGGYRLAIRVAQYAEMALERISHALGHLPSDRIQLVLSDTADVANGSAQILPYNIVQIYASAPDHLSTLNDFDDFIWILLTHELTHIVHMDTVTGLPAALNWFFGRTAYPNGAQPTWFIEGLATYFESALSSAGRIRSSLYQMYLRTAALTESLPELDLISGTTKNWPQGTVPYLYGAFFIDHLAQRFGQQALRELSQRMGGMLTPWSLNIIVRNVVGEDYPQLYQDWKDTLSHNAQRVLESLKQAGGLSPHRMLTSRSQHQHRPRLSPGGQLVLYYSAPTNQWPALRLVKTNGQADRPLLEVNSGDGAAFTPNGKHIVFSQIEVFEQFYYFKDLYLLDLETGQTSQLTHGMRARSPDVSPNGREVIFVQNKLSRTQLATLRLSGDGYQKRTFFKDDTQVYTPRYSPDGKQVVFSAAPSQSSGRNLLLLDLETGSIQKLTQDGFMDIDPVFCPDGRSILFSSDRTGIYNIYTLDLHNRTLTRLTNLATGAFSPEPSPDGKGMAFVLYGKDGYDIAWMDFSKKEYPTLATRPPRPAAPTHRLSTKYRVEAYQPWSTLLPRSWFPLLGQDSWGTTYGVLLSGGDVLGKLGYNAQLTFGPAQNQLYVDLGVWSRLIYPTLSMYLGRHVLRYYRQAVINGYSWPVDKEKLTLAFDASFPFSKVRQRHYIFFNYEINFYDRWTSVPLDPADTQPLLPDDSHLAWFSVGWSFSNVRRYIDSISAEEGWSTTVSLRLSHPSVGSGSSITEARFWLRAYLPILRDHQHVLALGLQGGIAMGDPRRKSMYSIGGLPIRDPIQDAYFGYRFAGLYLRGYPPGAFWGSSFLLGSIEYRMPLSTIEKGFFTLPFFLRQLHLAFFSDIGGVSIDQPHPQLLKVGVGTELRLDLLLAYHLPMTLRIGYGRGLSEGGENNFYLTLGWGF